MIFAVGTRLGLSNDNPVETDIVVQSLETGKRQVVIPGASYARYVATGHLVFARGGTLMAVPFDLAGLRITVRPSRWLEGVREAPLTGAAHSPSPAWDGWSMYREVMEEESRLVWMDRKGCSPWKRIRAPILGPGSQPMVAAWRLRSAGAPPMSGFATCRVTRGIRLLPTDISLLPVWTHDGNGWRFFVARRSPESVLGACRR